MTANGWFQILLVLAVVLAVTKPLGIFMARVFGRQKTFLDPVLRPVERIVYRLTGVDETHEMRWTEYAVAMLLFSGVSMALLYLLQRVQLWLPFNPQKLANVSPALAFNTAASFTTNTNWQNYAGEAVMSYLTQMAGLAYHNFTSAASGIDSTRSADPAKFCLTANAVAADGVMIRSAWRTALRISIWLTARGTGPEWISGN